MTYRPGSLVLRHIRGLAALDSEALSDRELLERFSARRDEAAFAALVERHGPMVWRVCYRVLREHHAAADPFQASFFVLARKAGAISKRELLPN